MDQQQLILPTDFNDKSTHLKHPTPKN